MVDTFVQRCILNGGARLGECERDAASRAATGSRNDGDFALQRSCQWTI